MKICRRYDERVTAGVEAKNGLTQQHFRDECDINQIIAKYAVDLAGNPTPAAIKSVIDAAQPPRIRGAAPRTPMFGDFYSAPDFRRAQEILLDANEKFLALPSRLRMQFGNNPELFMSWLEDPANRSEAERYGLLAKRTNEVVEKSPTESAADVEE